MECHVPFGTFWSDANDVLSKKLPCWRVVLSYCLQWIKEGMTWGCTRCTRHSTQNPLPPARQTSECLPNPRQVSVLLLISVYDVWALKSQPVPFWISSSLTLADYTDRNRYVNYESELGRSPGMVTCPNCREQVLTHVTYKVGTYAWLMCLLFILCG